MRSIRWKHEEAAKGKESHTVSYEFIYQAATLEHISHRSVYTN